MSAILDYRGTQRFVSGNICSEGLKSPEIFDSVAMKAREFSLAEHHLGLS